MKIEVFSFNNDKSFGYEIETEDFHIVKLHNYIDIRLNKIKSTISVTEKFKFRCDISSECVKTCHNLISQESYQNKKISKLLIVDFFKSVESLFQKEEHVSHFSKYNKLNNSLLDLLDESDIDKDINLSKIEVNNKELHDYIYPFIIQALPIK